MICYDMITKFVRLDVSRPSLAGGVTPHHLCPLTRLTIGILWPMCEEMFRGDCIFSHFLFGFITVNPILFITCRRIDVNFVDTIFFGFNFFIVR